MTNDLGSFLESDNPCLVRIPGVMMHSNDITSTTSKPPGSFNFSLEERSIRFDVLYDLLTIKSLAKLILLDLWLCC